MDITGMDVPDALRPVIESMGAAEVAQLTIKDLGDLGLAPATALRIFTASRKQVQAGVQEAEAIAADLEDDPAAAVLRRLAAAPKPSARLAQAADQVAPGAWLVLNGAGKVAPEASQAELKRLRKGLPARVLTTDGNRVVTPQAWAAKAAETVLLHPLRGTPLEDDGTDPHTGVSWADETLWLRAAVAQPEAGLAEAAIAAQLAEPAAPWALAARAKVEALDDDARRDLLRGRKRTVRPAPTEPVVTSRAPVVDRQGAPVAPWATKGTPFTRLMELLQRAVTPDELKRLLGGVVWGEDVVYRVAWGQSPAAVYADLADVLRRTGLTGDLLRALLQERRLLEPEIRAVAAAYGEVL